MTQTEIGFILTKKLDLGRPQDIDWTTDRQKHRNTERKKDRKTERQKHRKSNTKDRKIERQKTKKKDRKTDTKNKAGIDYQC